MKLPFLLIWILVAALPAAAQKKKQLVKDSLTAKQRILTTNVSTRSVEKRGTTEIEITKKLDSLVSAYSHQPNSQATWTRIRGEAETILLSYFQNGALMGTKPQDAYFVKMGAETMTSSDIANHKMILVAGLATVKPAEFKIITIEKINTPR